MSAVHGLGSCKKHLGEEEEGKETDPSLESLAIIRTVFERKCYTIHITRPVMRTINCIHPLLVNVFIYHFPIFFPLSSILLSVLERNLVVGKIVNFKSKLSDEREGVWTSCIEMAVFE